MSLLPGSPEPEQAGRPVVALLGLGGIFELTVESTAILPLPLEAVSQVGLIPGDLLSLDPAPASLHLEIYHELLAERWHALSPENRWADIVEFLHRPLTALGRSGALPIPREVFPLARGEKVVLQVIRRGLSHQMFLVRTQWD